MRGYVLGFFLILAAVGLAQATPQSLCTIEDSKRAFDAVDKLENWEAVRRFYKKYLRCDDGGIAEGVSDAITKLLTDKWVEFWRLRANIAADQQFEKFVLKHIDATASNEALQGISRNAQRRCPKDSAGFCKKINAAALTAIKEGQQ